MRERGAGVRDSPSAATRSADRMSERHTPCSPDVCPHPPPWLCGSAILDHSIIEVIVNNRTAIVGHGRPRTDAHTAVRLVGAGVRAQLGYWQLDSI